MIEFWKYYIGDNSDLLIHNVYAQLDTEAAGIANFGNKVKSYNLQPIL